MWMRLRMGYLLKKTTKNPKEEVKKIEKQEKIFEYKIVSTQII